tara:strand:- start:775 stop:1662 length:888 start_codon:yes stop_codon:yes gene_type:complete
MTIQLVRDQLVNSIINASKLEDNAVAFAKILSSDIETNLSASASATKLVTAAAAKAYADSVTPDGFQGGDGIDINTATSPDTIAVDLATNPGLQFTSNKLDVKVKSESGGSITKDGDGLYIANSAIANGKLANSTISGIALGANLNSLAAANGLSMTAYNGSAAVADLTIDLDGSSLAVGGSGLKVNDLGVGEAQLADNSVSLQKLKMLPKTDDFSANGSTSTFTLSSRITASQLGDFAMAVRVYRNGQRLKQVASSPADSSQYTVTDSGSATVITLGANPANGETLIVDYWYDA